MAEYQTITASPGESATYDVDEDFGGHCEHVLFDQTANDSYIRLRATGSDWTIRNVAWKGVADKHNDSNQLKVRTASGGEGLVENVYMGDGSSSGNDMNGVQVDRRHAGTITFRNVFVGYYADNGFYCSDPYHEGIANQGYTIGYGDTHIESCYSENNNICGFRIGGSDSYVEDSVAVVTSSSDVPSHPNGVNARCCRLHHVSGNLVENCDFYQGAGYDNVQAKDGGGGTVRNSRLEGGSIDDSEGPISLVSTSRSGASTSPPPTVPMSPEEAASGAAGACDGDGDCPDGHECVDGECVPKPIPVDGDVDLPLERAQTNANTSIRRNVEGHDGYTGGGFLDLEPRDGAYAEWPLDVVESGEYDLTIRFSNGGGSGRTATLYTGSQSDSITFPNTGAWNNWQSFTTGVSLSTTDGVLGIETTGDDAGQIDTVSLTKVVECSPTWNGVEKTEYNYCGNEGDLFNQWQNCEITTEEFQALSSPNQGTNALTLGSCPECNGDDECADDEVCEDGECVPEPDPCDNVTCGPGLVCEDGECVEDPTAEPPGQEGLNPLFLAAVLGAGYVAARHYGK